MIDVEALLAGTTPGPWRWGGLVREVRLESLAHGIPQVMSFRRKGMQGAEPVFWDRSEGGDPMFNGRYCTATERAVRERSYREQVVDIDTPDARLIAAAPELAAEVLRLRETLNTAWLMVKSDAYDAPGQISTAIRPFLEAAVSGRIDRSNV